MSYFYYYILISFACIVYVQGENTTNSSFWEHLPKDCGKSIVSDNKTGRITDGAEAKPGQFPWLVRLGRRVNTMGMTHFSCGGSLINRYYVISAAHCTEIVEIVRLGQTHDNIKKSCVDSVCPPPPQEIDIARYIFNDYCIASAHNDIYLLELAKPAVLHEYVSPVCIPRGVIEQSDIVGKPAVIAGWGLDNSELRTQPNMVMYTWATVADMQTCRRIPKNSLLTKNQLCIGVPEMRISSGPCKGDSGGPATMSMDLDGEQRMHLVGIVSFSFGPCEIGPAIYTDVSRYTEWILRHVNKH